MPTLEEIAEIAQVSRSTVSRVINRSPNVNPKTRQRVEEVVRSLGFQPNRAARSLAGGRTQVIGLVIPMGVGRLFSDPYFPILIQSVASACNSIDHSVMLWLAEPEVERRTIGQILYNGLIDGVIVSSSLIDDPLVHTLSNSKMPFVLIGRSITGLDVSYVDVDNVEGARLVVDHLLQGGRRRIATISGPQNMIAGRDRYEGYRKALQDWGLPVHPDLVLDGGFSEDASSQAMLQLLEKGPDAVFAASDIMAQGALRALQSQGVRIPEDIALTGFDDMPFAERLDPSLTTVRQPIQKTGTVAVEILIDLINNPGSSKRQIILPTELVVRDSS
jgi:LacI family transcriptional regulator